MSKRVPGRAVQHRTAGPYSPVLEIEPGQLVVLSGQVAVDLDGNVKGHDIEEQSRTTLENCCRLLGDAGCTPSDVFKVNVYLQDIADWGGFNAVYETVFCKPYPARTAIQAVLLPGFKVEVELWAAKSQSV